MAGVDTENLLVFAAVVTVVWVVIVGTLEVLLFDGTLRSAVVQGLVGGVVFALAYSFFRRNRGE